MIRFIVPGCPIAQPRQRHRIAGVAGRQFVQNYTPGRSPVADFKACVRLAASQACNTPLAGPVTASLVFVFPRGGKPAWLTKRSSWFRAWKDGQRVPHVTRPDCDNLCKSALDALNGIAFIDDKLVCLGTLEKWIAAEGESPHLEVAVAANERMPV